MERPPCIYQAILCIAGAAEEGVMHGTFPWFELSGLQCEGLGHLPEAFFSFEAEGCRGAE